MDMFPLVETLKVGAAYAALLYIWPNIVFRRLLRGKGLTFRFLFCAIVQPLLIGTVVLLLGLIHALNPWIVRLLFWGALAASLAPLLRGLREKPVHRAAERLRDNIYKYRKHLIEYGVLAVILLFATAFFLSGVFQDYSFGFFDQYLHYEWTRALVKGEIFLEGIYPEGMHCFIYALNVLFGVRLYSCMVFLGGLHNASMFLLAAYCLLKELLRSRWATLFVLAAWSFFDGIGPYALSSMARMSWTLPEEFVLYLVFLCPMVLVRYFRERDGAMKWYRDWNLLFLAGGVALAFATHFYALAMAFFPCCAVILAHFMELRSFRRLLTATLAAVCGLVIGLLPMLAAFAMGTELEGSLGWGFRTAIGQSRESAVVSVTPADPTDFADSSDFASSTRSNTPVSSSEPTKVASPSKQSPMQALSRMAKSLYDDGWDALFGNTVAILLIVASLLVFALAIARMCARLRKKPRKAAPPDGMLEGYLILAISLAAFVLLYAMPYMGLLELVRNVRILCVTQLFAFAIAGILTDVLIVSVQHLLHRALPNALMALVCVLLYIIAYNTDFHQTTYWWLFRYNASVTVTDRIMKEFPKGSYKIVSLWDEAYQADEEDWEELLVFMRDIEKGGHAIPTEYIFLCVEKNPLWWSQLHFTTAPRWLALENYETDWSSWSPSRCPAIWCVDMSPELVLPEIDYNNVWENYYIEMEMRTALFANALDWYEAFSAAHPENVQVYYEDVDIVCYMIRQDPAAPLNLAANMAR